MRSQRASCQEWGVSWHLSWRCEMLFLCFYLSGKMLLLSVSQLLRPTARCALTFRIHMILIEDAQVARSLVTESIQAEPRFLLPCIHNLPLVRR